MVISYAILTHNEGSYISKLITSLTSFIKSYRGSVEHEIVILDDYSTDPSTQMILRSLSEIPFIKIGYKTHTGDFSEQKNALIDLCKGDWIINLDADELISEELMNLIPLILEKNPSIEAYWIPRINIVEGLTLEHVQKWGWVVRALDGYDEIIATWMSPNSEQYKLLKQFNLIKIEEHLDVDGYLLVTYKPPVIMFPDPQMRVFKNDKKIRWVNKVHEKLTGFENWGNFPYTPEYSIIHKKDIKRQEQQNNFYEKIKEVI